MHPTLSPRQHSAAKFFLLALLIIVLDQLSKWAVHTYMQLGSAGEIPVFGQWAKLTYTLNPGMAFGAELPAPYGKLVLTAFRTVAVGGLIYYIIRLSRQRVAAGYIACMALILLNQNRFFNESQPPVAPNERQPLVAADAEKLA